MRLQSAATAGLTKGRGGNQRAGQTAELTLEAHTAGRPETTDRMLSVVAGGRYARVYPQVPIALPVLGQVRPESTG